MNVVQRIGLLFFVTQLALCGFAQNGIITADVGRSLPEIGAQAITQAIDYPSGVAADGAGGFYVSSPSQNRIYRVAADGSLSLTAGVGTGGLSGDGGLATEAQLNEPSGLAVDSAGNLYIADTRNHQIRKVTTTGIISTVAGNGSQGDRVDGSLATAAKLRYPSAVALDSEGDLYIMDNGDARILKVTATGIISTVAGTGASGFNGDGGWATEGRLNSPNHMAVDSEGNLYIAYPDNQRIRKVTPTGIISIVAGNGTMGFSGDGGLATDAQLKCPSYVAVDSAGNLYIGDRLNYRIRKVTPTGIISTVAGNGTMGFSGDGGLATKAQLNGTEGMAFDSTGNLYIADRFNNRIRKVTTTGIIGYTTDRFNNRIPKVTTAGIISTVAGNGTFDIHSD
jgi:trimeric autotransporter adhesin